MSTPFVQTRSVCIFCESRARVTTILTSLNVDGWHGSRGTWVVPGKVSWREMGPLPIDPTRLRVRMRTLHGGHVFGLQKHR